MLVVFPVGTLSVLTLSITPSNPSILKLYQNGEKNNNNEVNCQTIDQTTAIQTTKIKLPLYPDEKDVIIDTCYEAIAATEMRRKSHRGVPIIYFITHTYTRIEQVAELTRLSQTLLNVKNLVWLIVEESEDCSSIVSLVLFGVRDKIPYVHLTSPMPEMYKAESFTPRGISSRNAGLKWIIDHEMMLPPGIVYFGDDDNTYDLRLFEEIRLTKKVSMFPVGFIGTNGFSSPIVQENKVIGFSDPCFVGRKFPVDMAGFAVNIEVLKIHKPSMPYLARQEETIFLENLNLTLEDIEPLANNCTEVLVWQTQTVKKNFSSYRTGIEFCNLHSLMKGMTDKGVLSESTNGDLLPVCMNLDGYWVQSAVTCFQGNKLNVDYIRHNTYLC